MTAPAPTPIPRYHTLLGSVDRSSPQLGILGQCLDDRERIAAIDLNHMSCISLFGEPGAGKSYCMGTIIEMAATAIPRINLLPRPITTIIFHYSPTQVYKPEFCSSILPNDIAAQVKSLKEVYDADPARVEDCVLLAPKDMVATRREEFPGIACHPLTFASRELQAGHWKILTGAIGEDDSIYFQVMNQILRKHRDGTTTERLLAEIEASYLAPADKDKARIRVGLAAEFIDDARELKSYVTPGRLVIIDLRDEYLQKREALALLIVMLQLFADAVDDAGKPFPKLVVFDEAHKYMRDASLVEALTETIREMRHKSTSIMVASQDPPSVPLPIIELSTMVVMLKMTSPLWLKHVQQVKAAFLDVTAHQMAALGQGEAYVWAKNASDPAYTLKPQRFKIRPRATKHGGDTKVAVKTEATVPAPPPSP
ncbi:MAG: ATP-binding protein [Planctomycetes bacterium]|nr:ATP-binding protein [Planctomycetota bacterium]